MTVSIERALAEGVAALSNSGADRVRLDAGLLLSHAIGRDRTYVVAHSDKMISDEQLKTFRDLIARRGGGEPLQYITGHQEFFKLDFEVTPDVLIPRPETELIVEAVLEIFPPDKTFTFADVGTGSGCIAISLLHEFPKADATAIDISKPALQIARRNADRYDVGDRIRLLPSDLFAAMTTADVFDVVVSNPPYVTEPELASLQREVQYEPRTALAGGSDGLATIRRLLIDAPAHLRSGGYLIFEFGINQDAAIKELIDGGVWKLIEIRRDLQQIARMILLQKK